MTEESAKNNKEYSYEEDGYGRNSSTTWQVVRSYNDGYIYRPNVKNQVYYEAGQRPSSEFKE